MHGGKKDITYLRKEYYKKRNLRKKEGGEASWKLKDMIETMTYSKEEFRSDSRKAPES